jgi:hypothetical protein
VVKECRRSQRKIDYNEFRKTVEELEARQEQDRRCIFQLESQLDTDSEWSKSISSIKDKDKEVKKRVSHIRKKIKLKENEEMAFKLKEQDTKISELNEIVEEKSELLGQMVLHSDRLMSVIDNLKKEVQDLNSQKEKWKEIMKVYDLDSNF